MMRGPRYHEMLWRLACADPAVDTREEGNAKVAQYLAKYLAQCQCWGYTDVSVSDGNFLKFAMDVGHPDIVLDIINRYNISPNFIDAADGKTLVDFILRRIDFFKSKGDALDPKHQDYVEDKASWASDVEYYQYVLDEIYKRGGKRAD